MKIARRILLCGNSVILGSIRACLQRDSQFEVTTLASLPQELPQANDLKPDLLLFDLEASQTETVFSLLKADQALQLIGISPGINLVQIWHSQQMQGVSMQDLIELIKNTGKTNN